MSKSSDNLIKQVLNVIVEEDVKMVDLQFTDIRGAQHHISVPPSAFTAEIFELGKAFDGSSIVGWKGIQDSDMLLIPDPQTACIDPFYAETTLNIRCDVVDPQTLSPYLRDPRAIAKRAEAYMQSTGIADQAFFGPEPEFSLFSDVRWECEMKGAFYAIDSEEGIWNSGISIAGGNKGYRPRVKGGYFPLPPIDSMQDIRTEIVLILEEMGLAVEVHHHEVAMAQHEIGVRYNSLLQKADELQLFKYVVRNVAQTFGKTATFMPKPLVGDNGNGMHCHQSLQKDGKNLFTGDRYAGLSDIALYYIGGIIKHVRALNAFTNPATNSYKRLVPGFEAPVLLAYSARNRSAGIRIPQVAHPQARRIEVRFPDPLANPYLAFSAMLMAGLDGIKNKIYPGDPIDKDLYELPPNELKLVPTVAGSLNEALDSLEADHEFLLAGDVFTRELLDVYITMKRAEEKRLQMTTHPLEFEMYYTD